MQKQKLVCCLLVAFGLTLACSGAAWGKEFIVKDGKANAEIVIAENSPRTTRLAAEELRKYVEKISGAQLVVTNTPNKDVPVKIYVGRSTHADKLGVKFYDVKDGGYRIVSGKDWLVLAGRDDNFMPIEPWPRYYADFRDGTIMKKWDKLTGNAKWGLPFGGIYKNKTYFKLAPSFGKTETEQCNKSGEVLVWAFDERGSFNAVCDFLRRLGVRWYMPGDLGEVVPKSASIALPEIDETVLPAFPLRQFGSIRFGNHGRDVALWVMRMGLRRDYGIMIAHGIDNLIGRPEFREAHPEYFALYGGKRDSRPNVNHRRQLCLSSEKLFKENVDYARAVFDNYKFDMVSIWPPDGYVAICQCSLCEGKDTLERGSSGLLSDYVWDYVNRIAKEVAKTHPDKKILGGAYGCYSLPPLKIDKLNSNVVVCIVGGRRPSSSKPEQQEKIRKLREAWVAKTANPIIIFENYPLTTRGFCQPAFCAHVQGESINATKSYSQGEDIWFTPGKDFHVPGFNHFNLYFTARMYWEKDLDALYNEYCRLFYGPAEKEMKAFFDYCEVNWQDMREDWSKGVRALKLLADAEKKAGTDSVYAKRIALITDYLKKFKAEGKELAKPRDDKMELRACDNAKDIKIDGKLDEKFWQDIPADAVGHLFNLVTSSNPVFKTSFKVGWEGENLYFAIHCDDTGALNIGTKRNGERAIWFGDVVEIMLETDKHAYYQIAISPSGALVDLDRNMGKLGYKWKSQAEIAANADKTGWTVEIRIPVTKDENDPFHQVVGTKPDEKKPWHFNVCRQRIREKDTELSAFSPTGKKSFHNTRKFGKLYVK